MNMNENKTYIDSICEIMGSQKKRCLSELYITEQDLYEMNLDQFECAKNNIIEWMNDFYGIRRK